LSCAFVIKGLYLLRLKNPNVFDSQALSRPNENLLALSVTELGDGGRKWVKGIEERRGADGDHSQLQNTCVYETDFIYDF